MMAHVPYDKKIHDLEKVPLRVWDLFPYPDLSNGDYSLSAGDDDLFGE